MKSLPYLADHITIRNTLEECKGNVNNAVSKLLDAEERGSTSSTQGSSSVERDHDSDVDEEYCGPKKKQDRRLSRATQTAIKAKGEQRKRVLTVSSMIEDNYRHSQSDNDDWQDDPSYKNSDSASTSASDPIPNQPLPGGVRLKLSQPKRDFGTDELRGQRSDHNSGLPNSNAGQGGKTQQRQSGPKQKRLARREKKQLKKAVKERNQVGADAVAMNCKTANLTVTLKKGKENSPVIESGIKTLYI